MKITSITQEPVTEIAFLNAGRGPGAYHVDQLPVHVATVVGLPQELDAIVATADLQGRERFEEADCGPPRLLGETLPKRLAEELLPDLNVRAEHTGVLLAGDFYTVPNLDKRGGSGDVTCVWQAFAQQFKWVAGVAGNHDTFGDDIAPTSNNLLPSNAHYLDGAATTVDCLRIGGVGGIIGNPRKPHRKTEERFIEHIVDLADGQPDVLVLHDGPDAPEKGFRGSTPIREMLEQLEFPLVTRGHAHWPKPMVELVNGTVVINVDCRVVVLRREPTSELCRT